MMVQEVVVEDKDIILAIFGASFGIAGLILVFAGFLLAIYADLPVNTTTPKTRDKYRSAFKLIVGTLIMDIVLTASALSWLLTEQVLWLTIALFVLMLVAIPTLAIRIGKLLL